MLGMTNAGGLTAYKANQALKLAQEAKTTAEEAKQTAEQGGGGGGNSFGVGDVTKIVSTTASGTVTLKWTDPEDLTLNGVTLAKWAGTKVVRKAGIAPANVSDGDLVVDSKTRNAYQSTALEDTGLTNDVSYYYGFFPYTTNGVHTTGTVKKKTPSEKPAATLALSQNNVTLTNGGLTATVTITTNGAGAISIASSDEDCVQAVLENDTITLTAVDIGSATIRVSQEGDETYAAPDDAILKVTVQIFPADIADATPAQIQAAIDEGVASSLWDVGDSVPIELNGDLIEADGVTIKKSFNHETYYLTILGFDHNKELETNRKNSIHFILGKNENGIDIAFNGFRMNTSNTNGGGWSQSGMRTNTCPSFFNCLPPRWQLLVKETTKYNDNTGGLSSSLSNTWQISATRDKIFLLAESEVQSARSYGNTGEASKQAQYDYYKNGNSKIRYNADSTTSAVPWFLRSPAGDGGANMGTPYFFCMVGEDGSASRGYSFWEYAFAPGFALIGKS